jgi:hypothetical protein
MIEDKNNQDRRAKVHVHSYMSRVNTNPQVSTLQKSNVRYSILHFLLESSKGKTESESTTWSAVSLWLVPAIDGVESYPKHCVHQASQLAAPAE